MQGRQWGGQGHGAERQSGTRAKGPTKDGHGRGSGRDADIENGRGPRNALRQGGCWGFVLLFFLVLTLLSCSVMVCSWFLFSSTPLLVNLLRLLPPPSTLPVKIVTFFLVMILSYSMMPFSWVISPSPTPINFLPLPNLPPALPIQPSHVSIFFLFALVISTSLASSLPL